MKKLLLAGAAKLAIGLAIIPTAAAYTETKIWSNDPIKVAQVDLGGGRQKCYFALPLSSNRETFVVEQWPEGTITIALNMPGSWSSGFATMAVDGGTPFTAHTTLVANGNTNFLRVTIPNEGAGKDFLHDLWNGQTVHVTTLHEQADFSLFGSATAILRLHQCGDAIATETAMAAPTQPFGPGAFTPKPPVAPSAPTSAVPPSVTPTGHWYSCELASCGAPANTSVITIEGDFEDGDSATFHKIASALHHPLVVIFSRNHGGALKEGIGIGAQIRAAQAGTVVNNYCYSSCALAWLGGVARYIGHDAQVGFHAAYDKDTHQVMGSGNAVVGYYIASLGLGLDVAAWATSASPDRVSLMTPEIAKQLNVSVYMGQS